MGKWRIGPGLILGGFLPGDLMLRTASIAVVISCLFLSDAAAAQDASAGIWAARPRVKRHVEESVPPSALPGIAVGLPVHNGTGKMIGTISKILTTSDGSIRKVIVTSVVGNMMNLSPSTLSIANGIVTTE